MENNEFKNLRIQNCTYYYFDNIIKLKDFDIDNTLIDEKSQENILIYDISCKTLIGSKPLCIRFHKIDRLEFVMELDIWHCLPLKNMMLFMTELDIL